MLSERWRMVDGELYDIVRDPGQKKNVAGLHPDVVNELFTKYEQYYDDVYADGAPYNRFQLGVGAENPTLMTVRDWHPTAGRVIWKQEQLGDDSIEINGFWAVNIVQPGRYAIRLFRFPDDANKPMGANAAILKIGNQEASKNIQSSETSVTFELELNKGHALLQSWLTDAKTGGQRGAYFVEVTKRND